MTTHKAVLCLALLGIGLASGPLRADSADTNALALLHRASEFYAALKTMSCEVESAVHIQAEGMRQDFVSRHRISLERPARLAVEHTYGVLGSTLVYADDRLTIYLPDLKRYFEQEAPAQVADLLAEEGLQVSGMLDRTVPVLTTLLATNPYERIMQDNLEVRGLPPETVEGREYRRVQLLEKLGTVDLWIAPGEQPALYKIVADVSRKMAEEQGMEDQQEFLFTMTTTFKDWQFDQDIDPARFRFTPPPGAVKDESVEEEDFLFSPEAPGP